MKDILRNLFQIYYRVERQDDQVLRVVDAEGNVFFYDLVNGGLASFFPVGSSVPPVRLDLDVLLARDLGSDTWAAVVLIPPDVRIVTSGWKDLRHVVGPYFIGIRPIDGVECLINVETSVDIAKV